MINIRFFNLDKVLTTIEDISDKDLKNAMGKACAVVERTAKQMAPVDTGDLRRSISSRVENNGAVGVVYTPLEYAPYVEYGTGLFAKKGGRQDPWCYQDAEGNWHTTSGQKPQPYMRPALDKNREEIIKIFQQEVKK